MTKLTCEICGRSYEASSGAGLHVCDVCADPSRKVKGGTKSRASSAVPPKMLLCFICGREFGTASLAIHQAQCAKKRAIEQAKLPPEQRTTLQPPRSQEEADEALRAAMVPCPNCGRKFSDQSRLDVHLRSCKPESAKPIQISPRASKFKRVAQRSSLPAPAAVQSPREAEGAPGPLSSNQRRPSSSPSKDQLEEGSLLGGGRLSTTDPPAERAAPLDPEGVVPPAAAPESVPASAAARRKRPPSLGPPGPQPSAEGEGMDEEGGGGEVPCRFCKRKFSTARLARHEQVCQGVTGKKRRTFDSSKQRVTKEAAVVSKRSRAEEERKVHPTKTGKWRRDHAQLIEAVRAARGATKMTSSPPSPLRNEDYIQCPHCSRRFEPRAADRHIPFCATSRARPKPPPSMKSPAAGAPKKTPSPPRPPTRSTRAHPSTTADKFQSSLMTPTKTALAASPLKAALYRSAPLTLAKKATSTPVTPVCVHCGHQFAGTSTHFCSLCGHKRV